MLAFGAAAQLWGRPLAQRRWVRARHEADARERAKGDDAVPPGGTYTYTVQTSTDGSTWHTVATSPSSSSGTDTFSFPATQARYVRLSFPGGSGAGTPEIDEVTVTGP